MQNANIPTAKFWKVKSLSEAKKVINKFNSDPLVVKADGLASGKAFSSQSQRMSASSNRGNI